MAIVTFMIGNGFDLACGLKSSFRDSYDGYIKSPSSSEVIKKFKETIEKDINTWGDFEMKLAEYAHYFSSEDEMAECVNDYKSYLVRHLTNEQEKYFQLHSEKDDIPLSQVFHFQQSLESFYSALIPNDQHSIISAMDDRNETRYQYINFNYTTVFDRYVNRATKYASNIFKKQYIDGSIIHIHGVLGQDIVLGVDNESQFSNLPYKLSKRGMRRFIKPIFLGQYDTERTNTALSFIQKSNVICTYGLSLGESDLTWRKALASWLIENNKNHLVYYDYTLASKKYPSGDIAQRMDDEEDRKEELIAFLYNSDLSAEIHDTIFEQIHVPTGKNIFNYREIVTTQIIGTITATPPSNIAGSTL